VDKEHEMDQQIRDLIDKKNELKEDIENANIQISEFELNKFNSLTLDDDYDAVRVSSSLSVTPKLKNIRN
jgi:hypothetical protein